MRVVITRVLEASCTVDGECISQIGHGLCLLVGFCAEDDEEVLPWMVRKIVQMRIFDDGTGKMNRSLLDIGGAALSISQFTLYASCKKGNRPSFTRAASGEMARILYDKFNALLAEEVQVQQGIFGADMKIASINDGPVTIVLDSEEGAH